MTLSDVGEVGKECLRKSEGCLKVRGSARPFDFAAFQIKQGVECTLSRLGAEEIKPVILAVINKLGDVDGFVMCEPQYKEPMPGTDLVNVSFNDLRLSFTYGSSITSGKSYLWIDCWYYPATT
jgi:hypothetical protein